MAGKNLKFIVSMTAAALMLLAANSFAAVTGAPCVDCHTMHNSQGGAAMSADFVKMGGNATGTVDESANAALLKVEKCIGCHANANITNDGNNTIPQVNGTYGTDSLAGGTFAPLVAGNHAKAHNVDEFGKGLDPAFANFAGGKTPPGWDPTPSGVSTGVANGQNTWAKQLTCAGTFGCHGTHSDSAGAEIGKFDAVKGAHHALDGTIDGLSVGTSYRFLAGIKGIEGNSGANKWEYGLFNKNATEAAGKQNIYKAKARTTNDQTADVSSINFLCAECHGLFHNIDKDATMTINDGGGIASKAGQVSNSWIRHPSDINMASLLDAAGKPAEYQAYQFNTQAPVGLSAPAANPTYAGEKIVLCISCHRPHGSDHDDLLRWDYSGMVAGGIADKGVNDGCFRCHTTKD